MTILLRHYKINGIPLNSIPTLERIKLVRLYGKISPLYLDKNGIWVRQTNINQMVFNNLSTSGTSNKFIKFYNDSSNSI